MPISNPTQAPGNDAVYAVSHDTSRTRPSRQLFLAILNAAALIIQPVAGSMTPVAVPAPYPAHPATRASIADPAVWMPTPTHRLTRAPFTHPNPAPPSPRDFWQQATAPIPDGLPNPPTPLTPAAPNPSETPDTTGTCVITGEVSSATTLDPLAGAVVTAIGSSASTQTTSNGRFTLTGLPQGTLDIEVTRLGYFTGTATVTTLPNQPASVRIGLRVKPDDLTDTEYTLEEETIVGEYQENTQGDFSLSLALDSPTLTSSVSREDFARTAVSDAGEAVGKISGANIVDGKYAVVRGLADRYVTTLFNGAQVASADPSKKAIQLDLFPTSVIEAIGVDKTYTPNLPADFGGGAINILTRAFPEERILSYKFKLSVNDSLSDEIYVHPGKTLNFLGDNRQPMPSWLLESTLPDGTPDFLDEADLPPAELQQRWSALHASQNLMPRRDRSQPAYSQYLTYGETFKLQNDAKLGIIAGFSHNTGDTSNTSPVTNPNRSYLSDSSKRSSEWAAFTSAALNINDNQQFQLTYFNKHIAEDRVTHNSRIIEDTENLNYGYHLKNQTADPNSGNDYGADAIYYGQSWDIETIERDLEILQLKGNHTLITGGILRNTTLGWNLTNSSSSEKRPHSSHFELGQLDFRSTAVGFNGASLGQLKEESDAILGPQATQWAQILMNEGKLPAGDSSIYTWESIRIPWTTTGTPAQNRSRLRQYNTLNQYLVTIDESLGTIDTVVHGTYAGAVEGKQYSLRRTESTTEEADDRQANLTLPFHFSDSNDDRRFELQLGASAFNKERESRVRAYDLYFRVNDRGYPAGSLEGPGGLGEQLATDPSIMLGGFTGSPTDGPHYANALALRGVENISTGLSQEAMFLNTRTQWDNHHLSLGGRWESESYTIDIRPDPEAAFTEEQINLLRWEERDDQDSFLPAAALGTSLFNKRLDLLLAWSNTVARPTFWEFVPTQTLDQATGLGRRGNNLLANTEIENLDLSFALHPSDHTTIRLGLFDKALSRPLVTFYETSGVLVYKDAYVRLDNNTNAIAEQRDYTGTVRGAELECEFNKLGPFTLKGNLTLIDAEINYFYEQAGIPEQVTSRLPYQPSLIANATLGYTHEPWKASAYLVYNHTSDYPVILKRSTDDIPVTRDAIGTFDIVLEKRFEGDSADCILRTGIKNLLGQKDTFRYGQNVFNQDTLGRTWWLEAEIAF